MLAVEAQEVVHGEVEFGDGGMVVEGGVGSMPVVVVEEGEEISGPDGGVLVGASVGPLPQRGLDEAFGFAVGARSVGASEEVAQAERATTLRKKL